jgi:hypothetical protein
MAISLQADSTLPQGYILVDGQRAATISTTGLSATLAANTVTTSALASGAVTTEKIALGAVVTEDLANGAVTAAKMSGGQSGSAPVYGCRAWANFNAATIDNAPVNLPSSTTISVTAGNDFGFWTDNTGAYNNNAFLGVRYKLPTVNGVTGGLLSGVDVSTQGVQITEVMSPTRLKFRFLSGQVPTSTGSLVGTNNSNNTYQGLGIKEAGNVASIFRNSVGDYTITFVTPMPDTNYCVNANVMRTVDDKLAANGMTLYNNSITLSSFRIFGWGVNTGAFRTDGDAFSNFVSVFR